MPRSETRHFDADEATNPIELFHTWFAEAVKSEPNDPDAAALATATADGIPSVRMVLVKHVDGSGFRFFTNAESQKGREITGNPRAALCFHWKTQRRQVRVEGRVQEISAEEADRYFHSRARKSQVGAAVSAQSRPLGSRAELEHAASEMAARFTGEVPRPSYWRGYAVVPERIEFWQDGAFRLHDRMRYTRTNEGWTKTRLYP